MATAGGTGGQAGGGGGAARASSARQPPPRTARLRRRLRGPSVRPRGPRAQGRGLRRAPGEEAPDRPLPSTKEPTSSLTRCAVSAPSPGSESKDGTRPRLPVFPPPRIRCPLPRPSLRPRPARPRRRRADRIQPQPREAPPHLGRAPHWQGEKSTGLPIGSQGRSSKAPTAGPRLPPGSVAARPRPESRPRNAPRAPPEAVAPRRRLALSGEPEAGAQGTLRGGRRAGRGSGLRVLTALI